MERKNIYIVALLIALSFDCFSQARISVDMTQKYQEITGFGGHDPQNYVDMIVNDLGASFIRISLKPDFKPTENAEYNFDKGAWIGKERILELKNNGVKHFMATPWSPPAYMKENKSLTHFNGTESTNRLAEDYYEAFADYLFEFARQFKENIGIDLYGISLQNEPRFSQPFPSCRYTEEELLKLLKIVGPKFDSSALSTRIIVAEDMGRYSTNMKWFTTFFENDTVAKNYVDIWAVHGYKDGVDPNLSDAPGWRKTYNYVSGKNIPLWLTETSGFSDSWMGMDMIEDGKEKFVHGGFDLAKEIYIALKYGKISVWAWWTFSRWNANSIDETLVFQGKKQRTYYASKHFYKYIRPGAYQVESICDDNNILVLAFWHEKKSMYTLILINNSDQNKEVILDSPMIPEKMQVYASSKLKNFERIQNIQKDTLELLPYGLYTLVAMDTANAAPIIHSNTKEITILKNEKDVEIEFIDIHDGDEGLEQEILINAWSSNDSIISDIHVEYESASSNGKVVFSPEKDKYGEVDIFVEVDDVNNNSGNSGFSKDFAKINVTILPFVNHAPTIHQLGDTSIWVESGEITTPLFGISDGDDNSQEISIEAIKSNEIIQNLQVEFEPGIRSGTLYFTPKDTGQTLITLKLKDNGGTELNGVDSSEVSFTVNIMNEKISGTKQIKSDNRPVIYPNPSHGVLHIENPESVRQVQMVSVNGSTVYSSGQLNTPKASIDLEKLNLRKGMYIIWIMTKSGLIYKQKYISK